MYRSNKSICTVLTNFLKLIIGNIIERKDLYFLNKFLAYVPIYFAYILKLPHNTSFLLSNDDFFSLHFNKTHNSYVF